MKIKHEHIRMAMNAWAHPDGEKVPAAEITRAYFELGMTFPELYDDSHPEALARNTQKIFRWVEKDTPDAVEKIQALLPAIERQCHLCWWPECAATVQLIFGSWWRRGSDW